MTQADLTISYSTHFHLTPMTKTMVVILLAVTLVNLVTTDK